MSKAQDTCVKFIDTLSTCFEYFKNGQEIIKYIRETPSEEFGKELSQSLSKFASSILIVMNSDNVPTNAQIKFLDDVHLFKDKLHLKVFKPENKKTKKVIVKHLSKLLAVSLEFLAPEDSGFLDPPEAEVPTGLNLPTGFNPMDLMGNSQLTEMFTKNKELGSMVEKMTNKLMENKVDPMQLLGSMMSGDVNNEFVKGLFVDVENDMKSMDKDKLQEITKNIESVIKKPIV